MTEIEVGIDQNGTVRINIESGMTNGRVVVRGKERAIPSAIERGIGIEVWGVAEIEEKTIGRTEETVSATKHVYVYCIRLDSTPSLNALFVRLLSEYLRRRRAEYRPACLSLQRKSTPSLLFLALYLTPHTGLKTGVRADPSIASSDDDLRRLRS